MEVTLENLEEIKSKREEAKTIYLKWAGAVEVLESLLQSVPKEPKEPKVIKKDIKSKK